MSIGSNIKAARKAKGITQKELSKKINKTFSSVQKYELDIIQPPVDVIRDIAGALEVKVSDLLYDSPATSFSEMNKRLLENGVTKNWIINHSEEDQANMDLIEANYCIADKKGKQDIVEYSQMVADRTLKQRKQNGDPGKE
ncbi:helix-turn-helix domain-containing protein [Massiliimalia massiliensis]|uniref:helix-turn-helix domain-containing protein n=1 Tax=Massiliimalia massiliensis TaxID=1852384 RepID=UPI0009877533|nr:helix-turn-helix transcriptional regulator [Massiliimalia massiliensis]